MKTKPPRTHCQANPQAARLVSKTRVTAVTSNASSVHAERLKCMFLKPRAGGGRSRHRFGRGVEGWVLRASRPAVCNPFSMFALRQFYSRARRQARNPFGTVLR